MDEPPTDRVVAGPWEGGAATPHRSPIRYTLTDADIVVAQRAWLLAGMRWGLLLGMLVAGWAAIGIVMLVDDRRFTPIDLSFFGGILLAVALIPVFMYWRIAGRSLHPFHQQKAIAREFTLSWDADAISFDSTLGHGRLPWTLFSSWLDARETLLVYQSDILFIPIPRRVLTAKDAADIVGHLRAEGIPERQRFGFHSDPGGGAHSPGDP